MPAECPNCFLPKEESAWQCDGCGMAFRTDLATVRDELQASLRSGRVALVVTLLVSVAVVVGLVVLAMHGFYYVSVPLALAIVGAIGHRMHQQSVLREHLRELDRRHVALPVAATHKPS